MIERIQLSRRKGWRMPDNTAKVDRSTRWGNPFTVKSLREAGHQLSPEAERAHLAACFQRWLEGSDSDWMGQESHTARLAFLESLPALRGKNLACWCPLDGACHADVLITIANGNDQRDELR